MAAATLRPHRRSRFLLLGAAVVLLATVLSAPPRQAEAEPLPPPWPGLPGLSCDPSHWLGTKCPEIPGAAPFQWGGAVQRGMAGAVRSKQWARVPLTMMATHSAFSTPTVPETGRPTNLIDVWAWFVSPDGAKYNYGMSSLMRVRTVAFGSIPVSVTLQMTQQRDANGDPRQLKARTWNGSRPDGHGSSESYVAPSMFDNALTVHVRSLEVDGVDLKLRGDCSTKDPARLRLTSDWAVGPEETGENFDPRHGYLGQVGGTFSGAINIPAFAGCTTRSGEDLSPLLTATISGPGNPVKVRMGMYQCWTLAEDFSSILPPAPGDDTPSEAKCWSHAPPNRPPNYPAADYPNAPVVPEPVPYPDHAPEIAAPPSFPNHDLPNPYPHN